MSRRFATYLNRLDALYRDRPFFEGVRARLLAGFILILLVFVPLNVALMLWIRPQFYTARILGNVPMELCALLSLWFLFRGRLKLAGSLVALAPLVPAHLGALYSLHYIHPVSYGFRVFTFDVIFLLGALVFTSRRVAFGLLAFIVASHLLFFWLVLHQLPIAGSLEEAASELRLDGLMAIAFIFILGITVIRMIETAHSRSDQSLRETRALNDNLERLVAERTSELQQLNRDLVRLNDEKNTFMGMAAHDLRNPAVKIRMIAEMLEAEGDFSEVRLRGDLATIRATSTRLLGLLNDLLDVNAIEEGRATLRPASFDARAILTEVHDDFRSRAAAKGLDLVLVPPSPAAPARLSVFVDPVAIRQVLDNLVSNALKFSTRGRTVWLSVESVPGDRVRFAVRDEGPGLSETDRTQLFGKHSRLTAQPTGGETSTGLGLSIVKRLVESMAGTIAVDSVLGHGATFRADFLAAWNSAQPFGTLAGTSLVAAAK